MPPHRIGFDAIRALGNTTGLGNYARGVLRALHRHDPALDIHLYARDPGREEFRDLAAELNATVHLPIGPMNTMSRAFWRTFRMGRAAAADQVQLFHGLTHEIPRDLPGTGIPAIVTFHDLIFEKHPEFFPWIDRASYRWRYRWSARHATAVVAVSSHTRDDLVELYRIDPARIAVIPPSRYPGFAMAIPDAGRAAIRARYGLPTEFMLSVGTFEARKNHRLLLAALSMLEPGRAVPLVLVGRDGGVLESLQRDVARLGLDGRVYFRTDVATPDLPALMQSATIFLYPSLVEGFGMPIVEALSAGTPVIASSGGYLAGAGGPATRYLAPDAAMWAAGIEELLDDEEARHRLKEAGRLWAARFDGDRLAARLLAAYRAVLAGDRMDALAAAEQRPMESVP